MHIYPDNLTELLDFKQILLALEGYALHPQTRESIQQLSPYNSLQELDVVLTQVQEYRHHLDSKYAIPLREFPDIRHELRLLRIENAILQLPQVLRLRALWQIANELAVFFQEKEDDFPALMQLLQGLSNELHLLETLESYINPEGQIRDDASDALWQIRRNQEDNRKQSERVFRIHVQRLRKAGQLADIEENFINGRRVVGVLSEYKRENKGIFQGQSASGKITFLEPQNMVALNNDKIQLEDEERREIQRILFQISAFLKGYLSDFQLRLNVLLQFDLCRTKALLARDMHAHRPMLVHDADCIKFDKAYHPVLWLQYQKQQKPIFPLNVHLHAEQRLLVISGPNAGGKSVALKTIALLPLMVQHGLLIPAAPTSQLSLHHQLLGDIGDSQSIEDGLSTYSSRLRKMKYMLQKAGPGTLLVIDEFGTGSDPDMGGALAEVILHRLADSGAMGVVTTHFTNLKLLAGNRPGIVNACMLFNAKTLTPLYQLHVGEPGSSFTFEVAEKIGLEADILQEAKAKLSTEKWQVEQLLRQLQHEKNKLAKLQRDLQKQLGKTTAEKREFRELNDRLQQNMDVQKEQKEERQKLMDYGRKLHQLAHEWSLSKDKKPIIHKFVKLAGYEQALKKQQEAFQQTEAYRHEKIADILPKLSVGAKVYILNSREQGIITQLQHNKATVQLGRLLIQVGVDKLSLQPFEKNSERGKKRK
ncbi:MAG: endonuclease MutS2 [Chitinophagaceae bacterium]